MDFKTVGAFDFQLLSQTDSKNNSRNICLSNVLWSLAFSWAFTTAEKKQSRILSRYQSRSSTPSSKTCTIFGWLFISQKHCKLACMVDKQNHAVCRLEFQLTWIQAKKTEFYCHFEREKEKKKFSIRILR